MSDANFVGFISANFGPSKWTFTDVLRFIKPVIFDGCYVPRLLV
jgi:hypothetical protein